MKIIAVKIDNNFNFEKYLYLFDSDAVIKIMSFYQQHDRVVAFTSELLKKYYLAKELALKPTEIKIGYNLYKKPILLDTEYKIDFNISHSDNYIVMVIDYNADVGIDIERINYEVNPQELGEHVFSHKELSLIGNDIDAFFIIWTKKEALIKAIGTGFLDDTYKTTQLTLDKYESLANNIQIYSLRIFSNYSLAIATS